MKSKLLSICFLLFTLNDAAAQTLNIKGPAGSELFGSNVTVLSNGNLVVIDYLYDDGAKTNVGAVHLYNGKTLELISTLKGATAGDSVGFNGVMSLTNGNFVVKSQYWQNGATDNAGAATFVNAASGLNGVVSPSNSVVGVSVNDYIGSLATSLNNSNYLIGSIYYDNGAAKDAGALAHCNGTSGSAFAIGAGNALIGSTENDHIGGNGIVVLNNGNYLVLSPDWDNGADTNAGAVTFCSGTSGLAGMVSETNSLVGGHAYDLLGASTVYYYGTYGVITELQNGNFIVYTPFWHNDTAANAGAITWCNGTTGRTGKISKSNSLVGSQSGDKLGRLNSFGDIGIYTLSEGRYVVLSTEWSNGSKKHAGAVTWGDGSKEMTGEISASNSLIGAHDSDYIGNNLSFLSDGNLVICSPLWDKDTIPNAGAATWFNVSTGTFGEVSAANSVIGSHANDQVAINGCRSLPNGNYVISSPYWNNDTIYQAGASTWCSGKAPSSMIVGKGNSLVGSQDDDRVGLSLTTLNNGNYVVLSPNWINGTKANAGAATWVNGSAGITGEVSAANSLIGENSNDFVGNNVRTLNNGNYVVLTPNFDNGSTINVGAVTWCNGSTGRTGTVSAANSLIGSSGLDQVGQSMLAMTNGNYLILSRNWDNGSITNAGAITWCNGTAGRTGVVSKLNSLVGAYTGDAVGSQNALSLSSGKYIVRCTGCDNAGLPDVGAVVVCNADGSTVGEISPSVALMGVSALDNIGTGMSTLSNGNVVIRSMNWDNGVNTDAGAVTWIDVNNPPLGYLSVANSLVGTKSGDNLGFDGISGFNGDYYFRSRNWGKSLGSYEGAVTFANGSTGLTGTLNSCNSFIGEKAGKGGDLMTQVSNINKYILILRPMDTAITVFRQNGQSLAVHLDAMSVNVTGNSAAALVTPSCRIIALLSPNGNKPLAGKVKGEVWVETVPLDSFVKRHYQLTASNNADSADAKVTLFFTQEEFNEYNATHLTKLPTSDSDFAGKLNLIIEKRSGSSNDNTGLPASYTGAKTTINPQEADIVWNEGLKRWEVSFNNTGFSGFFVKAEAIVNSTDDFNRDRDASGIAVYPNPTDGIIQVNVTGTAKTDLSIADISGRMVMNQTLDRTGNHQIDMTALIPGVYVLKFSTGQVVKIVKQ